MDETDYGKQDQDAGRNKMPNRENDSVTHRRFHMSSLQSHDSPGDYRRSVA